MKTKIAMFVLSTASLFASAAIQPNLYSCTGHDVHMGYTTTSFIGQPSVNVSYKQTRLSVNDGSKINVQSTQIGNLVTVNDNRLSMIDGPMIRYTLVVPHIMLPSMASVVTFRSQVIRTEITSRVFGPARFGVVENNEYLPVSCTAKAVIF